MSATTRRGFLGTLGAAAAAVTAAPIVPAALPAAPPGSYLAELERFAQTLEPRFRSGELHAYREGDDRSGYRDPIFGIQDLCSEHFGLTVKLIRTVNGERLRGHHTRAAFVLDASPHTDVTGDGAFTACDHATEAAAWDLVAYAREAGWYVPTADEAQLPLIEHEDCPECGDPRFMHAHDDDPRYESIKCPVTFRRHVPRARVA